jgi:NADH:ubiquinone reductase (H+-translocating)
MSRGPATQSRARVVIVGGGFGGIAAARALRRAPVDITLIDRNNHHLFQPLLYQVASAVLPPSDITRPIRRVLRGQRNVRVIMGEVHRVDSLRRVVVANGDARELPYDYLIVAAGLRVSYFGHGDWARLAPGLKSVADAEEIRRRFLTAFEEAEKADDRNAHDEYLTFVVVGGGATGLELAGLLLPTARAAMRDDFRNVRVEDARVILLEGGPRILADFPESLSDAATRDVAKLGVQVRTNARVTRITPTAVWVGDERIATRTVFWAAGMRGESVAEMLPVARTRDGRVLVEPDLSIATHPEVFVIGDLAAVGHPTREGFVPGVAPAANQEGRFAAKNIIRSLRGEPRLTFRYFDKGMLATIGRHKAVGAFRGITFRGYVAWWGWLLIHILYLAGFRNRLSVMLEWMYAYFTFERGSRLISGPRRAMRCDETTVTAEPDDVAHATRAERVTRAR